jgi:hypothetical protein
MSFKSKFTIKYSSLISSNRSMLDSQDVPIPKPSKKGITVGDNTDDEPARLKQNNSDADFQPPKWSERPLIFKAELPYLVGDLNLYKRQAKFL